MSTMELHPLVDGSRGLGPSNIVSDNVGNFLSVCGGLRVELHAHFQQS
jgi:hypothetical protein